MTLKSRPFGRGKWPNVTAPTLLLFPHAREFSFKEEMAESLWAKTNQSPRLLRNWSSQESSTPHLTQAFMQPTLMDRLHIPGTGADVEFTVVTMEEGYLPRISAGSLEPRGAER